MFQSDSQFVHFKVQWRHSHLWFLTAVYANLHLLQLTSLWDNLSDISQYIVGPWGLIGDFNTILHAHERVGGRVLFYFSEREPTISETSSKGVT